MNHFISIIIVVAMFGNIAIAHTFGKPIIHGIVWTFTQVTSILTLCLIFSILTA